MILPTNLQRISLQAQTRPWQIELDVGGMWRGYGWQTVSLSTSVDQPWFTHLSLAIPSTQEALHMKANEVLADLSSAEVAADEKLVSRNSKEQLDRIAMV